MKTCFVIMPIGDQVVGGVKVTAAELKRRYDDLIKEAIVQAYPRLEIVRADEVAVPGTVTSDILTRLMHSDVVIADVSFPNPNLFYELGVRHACRVGTVIIKDRAVNGTPFDIAHQRHVAYDNTPTGLKELAKQFRQYFEHFDRNPTRPDNQLLELASLSGYEFLDYRKQVEPNYEAEFAAAALECPELMAIIKRKMNGEEIDKEALVGAMLAKPDAALTIIRAYNRTGKLDLGYGTSPPLRVPYRGQARGKYK